MNKTELIDAIATRSNTTKAQTTAMLNGLLEVIQETMASGSDVQLVGFGTFLNNFKQFVQHGGCLGFGSIRARSNGFNQFGLVHGIESC